MAGICSGTKAIQARQTRDNGDYGTDLINVEVKLGMQQRELCALASRCTGRKDVCQ